VRFQPILTNGDLEKIPFDWSHRAFVSHKTLISAYLERQRVGGHESRTLIAFAIGPRSCDRRLKQHHHPVPDRQIGPDKDRNSCASATQRCINHLNPQGLRTSSGSCCGNGERARSNTISVVWRHGAEQSIHYPGTFDTLLDMQQGGVFAGVDQYENAIRYMKAIARHPQVMSQMGISTYQSYAAHRFSMPSACPVNFVDTTSLAGGQRFEGVGLTEVATETANGGTGSHSRNEPGAGKHRLDVVENMLTDAREEPRLDTPIQWPRFSIAVFAAMPRTAILNSPEMVYRSNSQRNAIRGMFLKIAPRSSGRKRFVELRWNLLRISESGFFHRRDCPSVQSAAKRITTLRSR